jgi:hypothetical protein
MGRHASNISASPGMKGSLLLRRSHASGNRARPAGRASSSLVLIRRLAENGFRMTAPRLGQLIGATLGACQRRSQGRSAVARELYCKNPVPGLAWQRRSTCEVRSAARCRSCQARPGTMHSSPSCRLASSHRRCRRRCGMAASWGRPWYRPARPGGAGWTRSCRAAAGRGELAGPVRIPPAIPY